MKCQKHHKRSILGVGVLVGLGVFATLTAAQEPPPPLTVHQIRSNVYWTVGGAGGNTGFIIGDNGVIAVDAKTTAQSAKEMLAEIAKITPKPVTHVILTHTDADHVNGLAGFPKGLTIIAHENCEREMEAAINTPNNPGAAALIDHLPNLRVANVETLTIDGVRVNLLHYAPAHTDGDLFIYLPDQKLMFAGDMVTLTLPWPLIHLAKNGSSQGWIQSMKAILMIDADVCVPGHGDALLARVGVQKQLTAAEQTRTKIGQLVAQNMLLDDIKKALAESPQPPGPGPRFPTYAEVVFTEFSHS
jgi:cyclase